MSKFEISARQDTRKYRKSNKKHRRKTKPVIIGGLKIKFKNIL